MRGSRRQAKYPIPCMTAKTSSASQLPVIRKTSVVTIPLMMK
jgi:hypothetical protein